MESIPQPSKIRAIGRKAVDVTASALFLFYSVRGPMAEGLLKDGSPDTARRGNMIFQVFQSPESKQPKIDHGAGLEYYKDTKIQKVQPSEAKFPLPPLFGNSTWETIIEGIAYAYLGFKLFAGIKQAKGELSATTGGKYATLFNDHLNAMVEDATIKNSSKTFRDALNKELAAKHISPEQFTSAIKVKLARSPSDYEELVKSLVNLEATQAGAQTPAMAKVATGEVKKIKKQLNMMGLKNTLPGAVEETLKDLKLSVKIDNAARSNIIVSAQEMKAFLRDPQMVAAYGEEIVSGIKDFGAIGLKTVWRIAWPKPLEMSQYANSVAVKMAKDPKFLPEMVKKNLMSAEEAEKVQNGVKISEVVEDRAKLAKIAEESRPYMSKFGSRVIPLGIIGAGVATYLIFFKPAPQESFPANPSAKPGQMRDSLGKTVPSVALQQPELAVYSAITSNRAPNYEGPYQASQIRFWNSPLEGNQSQIGSERTIVRKVRITAPSPDASGQLRTTVGLELMPTDAALAGAFKGMNTQDMPSIGFSKSGSFFAGAHRDVGATVAQFGAYTPGQDYDLTLTYNRDNGQWSYSIMKVSDNSVVPAKKVPTLTKAQRDAIDQHPDSFQFSEFLTYFKVL